ncbi:diguanylate cyclase domain-containing protein [Pararhizobium antarcticum]|uniref:Uncharacterized protein n=1 Tax=Pararhizobium antarcticum TaxID=1798805 RepID=A0A657M223_9HYPH|nr:diguanylate cyclase [Pararhizobium antarcticum]OJG00922.1 hypothetical protein AX760_25185 [Pararhizobium antarcticum]
MVRLELQRLKGQLVRCQGLEEGWRRALDASNQGAWAHDLELAEFYYSEGWRRIRGIVGEMEDLSLEAWIKSVHPEDRVKVLAAIDAQNSGQAEFNLFEYRERHRAGHWVWIESRSSILARDDAGRATRIVGTDADITARKSAEQTIEDISRKLALAIEVAEIALFEADLDTGVVRRDRRLHEMYGLDREISLLDETGVLLRESLHPEDREACISRITAGIESGLPFENEFRIVTPTNEIRHLKSRSVPFVDQEGREKLLGVNWDITKDRNIQKALRDAAAHAEARSRALEEAKETIRQIAIQDELTGLLNRRGLNEHFATWKDDRAGFSAILHLDLDNFKSVNDEFGHQAGDTVLKTAAERIRAQLKDGDVLARWGGDEFVLLCAAGRRHDEIAQLGSAIVAALREPCEFPGGVGQIGASIGVAEDQDELTPDELLVRADSALYRAKALGRSRVIFA